MNEQLGAYVGWAAPEGSFIEVGPLFSEPGDIALMFSGEECSAPETVTARPATGQWISADGRDRLVHLVEERSFPSALNGWFHGLAADLKRRRAVLFNDRYGARRLYYHESDEGFYFAAEAKALLAVLPRLREVDPRGLGELISCGCVLEARTLFKKIFVMPPASAWVFESGVLTKRESYFDSREWENQTSLKEEDYYEQVRAFFSRNLSRYFTGPLAVGMSLTGGLDTRLIMAWLKPEPGSLPCYSFGSSFRDCEDVRIARAVAARCGQPHETITVGPGFLSRFDQYAERTVLISDGTAAVNFAPDLFVNERAKEIAPVRMTGNFGGEVMRGVVAFKPVSPAPGLFEPSFAEQFEEAARTYAATRAVHPLTFAAFRQTPWHHHGLLALERSQLCIRSPYLDNDLVRVLFRSPSVGKRREVLCARLIADGNRDLARLRTDRGAVILPLSARNLALRTWLNATFRAEYVYDYGMPQWAAMLDRRLRRFHLERFFLGRHKFKHFRYWYQTGLSDYVRGTLLNEKALSRPYLVRNEVSRVVRAHVSGAGNYTSEIHKLLTVELMHRLFIDSSTG